MLDKLEMSFRNRSILAVLILCAHFVPTVVIAADWSRQALRLTGESNFIRSVAIKNLRQTPQIADILLREMSGPKKALALDAITALRLTQLVPRLLEAANQDDTGQTYLTIDALITEENVNRVLQTYRERLLCRRSCAPLSAAGKIVMLETLGRAGSVLTAQEVRFLFKENDYEVRGAVLRYVRRFLLKGEQRHFLEVVELALESRPHQVRRQARYLLDELKSETKAGLRL